MARVKDIKQLGLGGMNLDVADEYLRPEDSRERYNCRSLVSEDGTVGIVSNIMQNSEVVNSHIASGDFECIGWCADVKNNAILYFLRDKVGVKHGIYRYNIDSNTIDKIFEHSCLNFQEGYRITHSYIVGDLLYFTDGYDGGDFYPTSYNPPRKINLVKAYNYTNGSGTNVYDTYGNWDFYHVVDKLKPPPLFPIEYHSGVFMFSDNDSQELIRIKAANGYADIEEYKFNNLNGKLFQFIYRYVYDDGEVSAWSIVSRMTYPEYDENLQGNFYRDIDKYNGLVIKFYTGSPIVHQIDLAYRDTLTGNWKLFDRIRKYNEDGDRNTLDNTFTSIDDDTWLSYLFLNDKATEVLDQEDVARPFDYVPQIVSCQELIENNRNIDACVTEGYDNVDIDIKLQVIRKDIDTGTWLIAFEFEVPNTGLYDIYYYVSGVPSRIYVVKFTIPQGGEEGDLYRLILRHSYDGGETWNEKWIEYFRKYEDTDNDVAVALMLACREKIRKKSNDRYYFMTLLPSYFPDSLRADNYLEESEPSLPIAFKRYDIVIGGWQHKCFDVDGVFYLTYQQSPSYNTDLNNSKIAIGDCFLIGKMRKDIGFKDARNYELGLVYLDRGNRSGSTNISEKSIIRIKSINEYIGGKVIPFGGMFPSFVIHWHIYHRPPEWATHYQWVIAKSTSRFIQFYISALVESGEDYLELVLNEPLTDYIDEKKHCILEPYTFKKGDRIRFITAARTIKEYEEGDEGFIVIGDVVDYEILGIEYPTGSDSYMKDEADESDVDFIRDSDGKKLRDTRFLRIVIQKFNYDTFSCGVGSIVEIYSPQKDIDSEENLFYEMGEVFEVGNPHTATRYHKRGNYLFKDNAFTTDYAQDQSPNAPDVVPAKGVLNFGDVVTKYRITSDFAFPVYDYNFSDFYKSSVFSFGRVNGVNRNSKRQQYISGLRWSGLYLENTQVNNLSRYLAEDFITIAEKHGKITRIVEDVFSLIVRQQYKTHSIYIGRAGLAQAERLGVQVVVSSNNVLGSRYPWKQTYGSDHPEGEFYTGMYHYFIDVVNGVILRQSENGFIEISKNYGLNKFVSYLCDTVKDNPSCEIITGYDKRYNEIYFTVRNNSGIDIDQKTFVFNESMNKWVSFVTLYDIEDTVPECYASLGNTFLSFINGKLYRHNEGSLYNTFFGRSHSQKINVVGNIHPLKDKVFKNILIDSLASWFTEQEGVVVKSSSNNLVMKSELPSGRFVNKHGVKYCNFLQNGLTRDIDDYNNYDLVNGIDLSGNIIYIDILNSSQGKVELSSFIVESDISELS